MVTFLVEGDFDKEVISSLLDTMGLLKQCEVFKICETPNNELWNIISTVMQKQSTIAVIIDSDYCKNDKVITLNQESESLIKENFWKSFEQNQGFDHCIKTMPFHVIGYEENNTVYAGEMECLFIPQALYNIIKPCAKQYETCIDEQLKTYWKGNNIPPKYREFFKAPIPFRENFSNTGFDKKFKQRLTSFFKEIETSRHEMNELFDLSTFDRLKAFLSKTIN